MNLDLLSSVNGKLVPNNQILDMGNASQAANAGFAGPSFSSSLQTAFDNVNAVQNSAADAAKSFATGQISDIHSVMIAAQKANVALELTSQIRNRVLDAYQTVMQTSM